MEQYFLGAGTEDGENLGESFENVYTPSSFSPPVALPPRPKKPPPATATRKARAHCGDDPVISSSRCYCHNPLRHIHLSCPNIRFLSVDAS